MRSSCPVRPFLTAPDGESRAHARPRGEVADEQATIRVGVAGLGMAGGGILSSLRKLDGIEIVAAGDPRGEARDAFEEQFGGRAYDELDALCGDDEVDAIWIATPTQFHAAQAQRAAEHGKHIVVEKPFAASLAECQSMIDAAKRYGVALISGGARSFDPAFVAMRRLIESGRLGRLGALNTWSLTGWIIRPREPYEVDVAQGGGTVFNQAPHPIDVLRLLGGGMVRSVRGTTASWMAERPCPGYFTAYLEFEDGTPATLTYNGHGYMQGWELLPWGETPGRRDQADRANAYRRRLKAGPFDERESRDTLRFGGYDERSPLGGGTDWVPLDAGLVVVSLERGEIRQSAQGLYVYDDDGRHDEPIDHGGGARLNEVRELRSAIAGEPALHDGQWGMATMEVVLALMESSRSRKEIHLEHQVSVSGH